MFLCSSARTAKERCVDAVFGAARITAVATALILLGSCRNATTIDQPVPPDEASVMRHPLFTEVTDEPALNVVHRVGPVGKYHMAEIVGPGAAFADFDNDGDLDVFLVGGVNADSDTTTASAAGVRDRLLIQESNGHFVDVTQSSGIRGHGFGMGVAVGDIDNDGDLDLYVTNYGPDQLWRNDGDATFTDVTQEAGIQNSRWGTGACFVDYDRDGWLDLYVANYVDYFPGAHCEDGGGRPEYCGPESLNGTVDKLFHNLGSLDPTGHLKLEDVTISAGISGRTGRGLGVCARDFNGDGLPDIYVANDMQANSLWLQQDDGTFQDGALLAGVAYNALGEAEASMGIVAEDLNRSDSIDIFLTHFHGQTNTLYLSETGDQFVDATPASGLGQPSLPYTAFGVAAFDLEHDGDLDLGIVNGRVKRGPGPAGKTGGENSYWNAYAEPNQLFLNDGRGVFAKAGREAGLLTTRVEVSRALAAGDIDNDGDVDLLVTNCGGVPRLYRNDVQDRGHWLTVRAVDPMLKRDAFGSQVTVETTQGRWNRIVDPCSGYLTANDVRLHFGLAGESEVLRILVRWPDGMIEEFPGGPADRFVTLNRGASGLRRSDADE